MSARNPDNDSEFDGDNRLESGYASLEGERQDISKVGGTGNVCKWLLLLGYFQLQ